MNPAYLLDANVFIEAKNSYYQFGFAPGFWDWLDKEQAVGHHASIQPIYEELEKGNDDLAEWVKARDNENWFLPVTDLETQTSFSTIAEWVMRQPFKEQAKEEFLGGGDPWLIAKALTLRAAVVTHEKFELESKKRVPIPNVCEAFGVMTINTFQLIQRSGAQFGLVG